MKKMIMLCSVAMSLMLMVAMMVGCESADGYSIDVSVSSYTVGNGGTVSLTASGWEDYTWSLSDGSLGSLNKLNGESVIYTSRASSGTQKVTVTARGSGAVATTTEEGSSSNSNNDDEKNNEKKTTTKTSSPLVRVIEITHK